MTNLTRLELIRLRQAMARECREKAIDLARSERCLADAQAYEQRAAELQQEAA